MPYITKNARTTWEPALNKLAEAIHHYGCSPGDLNYLITNLIDIYMARKGLNYTHLNDVVGALESAKAEFQRRVVAPYEDSKIKENGDVYNLEPFIKQT